jgi:hypothetical protein
MYLALETCTVRRLEFNRIYEDSAVYLSPSWGLLSHTQDGSLNCGRTVVLPGRMSTFSHGLVYTRTHHVTSISRSVPYWKIISGLITRLDFIIRKGSSPFERIITLQHEALRCYNLPQFSKE